MNPGSLTHFKPEPEKFKNPYFKGQRIKVKPHHDMWMAGFRFGRVTSKRGDYVYVEWDENTRIKRKFHVTHICSAE